MEDGFPFRGTIPQERLYDENGKEISEKDLNNGDVLDIYGDGCILVLYPAQYPGINRIEITEKKNQEYIEEYSHFLERN